MLLKITVLLVIRIGKRMMVHHIKLGVTSLIRIPEAIKPTAFSKANRPAALPFGNKLLSAVLKATSDWKLRCCRKFSSSRSKCMVFPYF